MNYILFDGDSGIDLLPFTYTRAVADIRVGILTIREKWEKYLGATVSTITKSYLQEKFPVVIKKQNIHINASYLPTENIVEIISNLSDNQAIVKDGNIIAFFCSGDEKEINLKKSIN